MFFGINDATDGLKIECELHAGIAVAAGGFVNARNFN
jgi:hypothetical protein